MRRLVIAAAACLAVLGGRALSGDEKPPTASGAPRPVVRETVAVGSPLTRDLLVSTLPSAAGDAKVPLGSLGGGSSPLVAMYWSARCPVCRRYGDSVRALAKAYEGRVRFAFVFVNAGETDAAVKTLLDAGELPGTVALDRPQDTVARLGVSVTPTALLVDGSGVLRYRGPIDDDRRNRRRDFVDLLKSAIDAVLAGQPVENAEPRAFGSSVRPVRR